MKHQPGLGDDEPSERHGKRGMKLEALLAGAEIGKMNGSADVEVHSVAYDSRKITPGGIFFALRGEKLEGAKFVEDAVRRGAVAVASEDTSRMTSRGITLVELLPGSGRRGLARAAANFYGHPADALQLVGVTGTTGTNGKTTVSYLVDSILRAAGHTTGLIGTTGYRTPKGSRAAVTTTPESLDLQQMFAEIRDAGGTHAVLEASSHALAM